MGFRHLRHIKKPQGKSKAQDVHNNRDMRNTTQSNERSVSRMK